MRKIGFDGGNLICELGPSADVELFFECLHVYAEAVDSTVDWGLLIDRLYRRYLRLDELDPASTLMERARDLFEGLPTASSVDWGERKAADAGQSGLDLNQPTLADVFSKYFEDFSRCVASARSSYEKFKSYPGDVPPLLSSTAIWSPIPPSTEIGREEAIYRRTDHQLPA